MVLLAVVCDELVCVTVLPTVLTAARPAPWLPPIEPAPSDAYLPAKILVIEPTGRNARVLIERWFAVSLGDCLGRFDQKRARTVLTCDAPRTAPYKEQAPMLCFLKFVGHGRHLSARMIAMVQLKEPPLWRDREIVMARLARKIGRGHDAIYHGTRHLPLVLRIGKLAPANIEKTAVFFTRSPEVAAYWANMWGREIDQFCGGILVLNRTSLVQNYRLEPSRYAEDWKHDEREESVWGRSINIRRHLLGVVRPDDVDAIVGPPRHRYFPKGYSGWSDRKMQAFWKEEKRLAREIVREGRAKVRKIIVQQRGSIGASDRQSVPRSGQG